MPDAGERMPVSRRAGVKSSANSLSKPKPPDLDERVPASTAGACGSALLEACARTESDPRGECDAGARHATIDVSLSHAIAIRLLAGRQRLLLQLNRMVHVHLEFG